MAMRRPRIKPVANILSNSKRKPKPANDVKAGIVSESDVNNSEDKSRQTKVVVPSEEKETLSNVANLLEVRTEPSYDTNASVSKGEHIETTSSLQETTAKAELFTKPACENYKNVTEVSDSTKSMNQLHSKKIHTEAKETVNDSESFKYPPKIDFQRAISHTSNSGLDDVFYSDIEENALQMDLEKSSSNGPLSPSKSMGRTRIRPTPHFGQRRNSYVGSSPSPHTSASEDNHHNSIASSDVTPTAQSRRERHHSASLSGNTHSSLHHHTPHKYLPAGITHNSVGRIRTESGCSAFSDSIASPQKTRKADEHKQTARKDYEARFHNGVPEKSLIKMSDLIFYNPVTNPMEQKPIPNVKLEQKENSSNDDKQFIGKLDIDTNPLPDETEAVPVPQLKLNAKGELILDDKSLVIETTAEQEARKALANSSPIYLDEYTGMNGFYSRKSRTRVWLPSDTIKFYRCLQNIGTDFSLMVSLFPNRTRRDLKLKFKKEERKNGHLINKALLYPKQFDVKALKQQINEVEKLQGNQANDKKKKSKNEKKKINCPSKATRILINAVYQNENNLIKNNDDKSDSVAPIEKTVHIAPIENDNDKKDEHKESEKKRKVKSSKKASKNLSEVEKLVMDYEKQKRNRFFAIKRWRKRRYYKRKMLKEITVIKEEIKVENKQESNETEFQDTKQLETEMDELLDMDAEDVQYDTNTYGSSASNVLTNSYPVSQYNEQIVKTSKASPHAPPFPANTIENNVEIDKYEHKTFVNLDDGSLSVYSNIKDDIVFITSPELSPARSTSLLPVENDDNAFESTVTTGIEITDNETCSSMASERELNEADIQSILTELAEGSLVLVSSLDPDDPDKVLNEIYMVDKNTGDLCEEPLSIPDNIVQCILTVVN